MRRDTDTQVVEQAEISKRNEFELRTSLLRSTLAQAQSMLAAARWEPADVRAKAITVRELAVTEAREALERHLRSGSAPQVDSSWLD